MQLIDCNRSHSEQIRAIFNEAIINSTALYTAPIPPFAEAAAAIGHIHMELDPDGIARSVV